jgi:hypothetical protein
LFDLIISVLRLRNKDVIEVQKIINIAFRLLNAQQLNVLFNIHANAHIDVKINVIERIVVFL